MVSCLRSVSASVIFATALQTEKDGDCNIVHVCGIASHPFWLKISLSKPLNSKPDKIRHHTCISLTRTTHTRHTTTMSPIDVADHLKVQVKQPRSNNSSEKYKKCLPWARYYDTHRALLRLLRLSGVGPVVFTQKRASSTVSWLVCVGKVRKLGTLIWDSCAKNR
jgi:hypothetical protein